ncbi:inositol monophosphatase family protein [Paenibacillus puerhi]|uniref:inositol monophosphatase family protein n=1 Tax=Paenibacillus puerhi TaxID=2692622 RepID=UPI00135CCC7A|nr:inositol monophosphatase [Paenibacillus puerhi]
MSTKEVLSKAKELSVQALLEAGRLVKERFDNLTCIEDKDGYGDLVTEADREAEAVILEAIRSEFPGHRIDSEEAGDNGISSDWLWLVDPLDGTNNYAIGLPVFAVSVALLYKGQPLLGVIYEPMTERMFVAVKGEGATCNGARLEIRSRTELAKGTVGWIQGHQVRREEAAVRLRQHLDLSFKRMMRLWAPTIQWSMLAKGDIEGIVLYNSEGGDLYAGVLLVLEAGGLVLDFEGRPFEGMLDHPYLIACHPDNREQLVAIVQQGLLSVPS